MRDREKPFTLYRSGPWNFKIVPRNGQGWRQMIVWIALSLVMTGLSAWFLVLHPEGPLHYAGLAVFLLGLLGWTLGGIWWMRARSEVIDVNEMLKLKREQDRKRRGR